MNNLRVKLVKSPSKKLKHFARLVLIVGMFCFSLAIAQAVEPTPPTATPGSTTASPTGAKPGETTGLGSTVRSIGGQTTLPSYDAGNSKQSYHAGASQITSAIYFILDFLKYVLGSIAVIMIIISGVKLIISGRGVDEAMTREKETIRFAFSGLLLIIVADQIVRIAFFGEEGEIFRSAADLQTAAAKGVLLTTGIGNLIKVMIPSIAVLFFVIAGVRLITSRGEPEKLNKAKTQMTWAVAGLVLAGLAQYVVTAIIFPNNGTTLSDPQAFAKLVITLTNFIAGFISTIAVTMIIYAGYIYVVSLGGEGVEKAKKILTGAIIGLLISMAAFALVNTFVQIPPAPDAAKSSTAAKPAK